MWEQTFGEASMPVGKLARIQAPRGVYLRTRPVPGASSSSAPIPFNSLVHVERSTTQAHANERWCYVIATDAGTAGFCEERYVAVDPPEPTATLRRTTAGERLAVIAEEAYGAPTDDSNSRLYVQALYIANRDRAGVTLDHVDLSFRASATRGEDEEQTLKIYKGAKVIAGTSLWIPSKPFIEQLKASGAITSGSTYMTQAWDAAEGVVSGAIDGARYVAGIMVGMLEGAYGAVVDLFKGAVDMVEAALKVVWHLVTGNPGRIKDMVMSWVDKMKLAWERRGEIADDFLKKWNADSPWDRGHFQGEVLGWVMMTILLVLLTLGEAAPGALGGITLRWPQLVTLLQAVDTLGDVTTYLGAATKAVKLPGSVADYLASKLGKTERTVAATGVATGGAAGKAGRRTERASRDGESFSNNTENQTTERITIAGYAQHPRTHPWLKNPDGARRTVDEALEIARANGVDVADDVLVLKLKGKHLPDNTYARYFSAHRTDPNQLIRWEDFYDKDLDELVVHISEDVFRSDEAIVAILAHEMHELSNLRRIFVESGGSMTMRRLRALIHPGISKNLHDQAWDVADKLVFAMRKAALQ
jgi:hypothetical protein